MAEIKLTRGFATTVDDELFAKLNANKWYASGPDGRPARRLREGNRPLVYMYHEILNIVPGELRFAGLVIDHIDGNPLNNRRANLRLATYSGNSRNTARHTQRVGISVDRTHGTFKVYLDEPNQKRKNLGTRKTREEAEALLAQHRKTK